MDSMVVLIDDSNVVLADGRRSARADAASTNCFPAISIAEAVIKFAI
jgi:hypothetical protein